MNELKELLTLLVQVVLIPAIPIVLNYLSKALNSFVAEKTANIENERLKTYIAEAANSVTTAVESVGQVYVDSIKASGKFTPEEQKIAFNKAKEVAVSMITTDMRTAVTALYGDFDLWLDAKIEQAVKHSKVPLSTPALAIPL